MSIRLFLNDKLFWYYFKKRANLYHTKFIKAPLYFSAKPSYMKLVPSDHISQQIAFTGAYEYNLSKKITNIAKQGDQVLVDVGANMGYFSILFGIANKSNKVFAFEASPRNHQLLTHNIKLNKLENQVTIIPKAAGKESGVLPFSLGHEKQTGWGGISASKSSNTVEVEVLTLDEYFANKDTSIDVLKVDVEGADTWVLEGAKDLIQAGRIKEIYYEENLPRMKTLGIQAGTAQSMLENYGYQVVSIEEGEFHAFSKKAS